MKCPECHGTGKFVGAPACCAETGEVLPEFTTPCFSCNGKGALTLVEQALMDAVNERKRWRPRPSFMPLGDQYWRTERRLSNAISNARAAVEAERR